MAQGRAGTPEEDGHGGVIELVQEHELHAG